MSILNQNVIPRWSDTLRIVNTPNSSQVNQLQLVRHSRCSNGIKSHHAGFIPRWYQVQVTKHCSYQKPSCWYHPSMIPSAIRPTLHNPSEQVSIQVNSSRSNTNHLKKSLIGSLASQINPKRTSVSPKSKFHQISATKRCSVTKNWLSQRMMLVPRNKFPMQRSMTRRTTKRNTLRAQDFHTPFRRVIS